MKKTIFFLSAVATLVSLASCNKQANGPELPTPAQNGEIALTNGVGTKGYITGTTFYDTAVAELHNDVPTTEPRTMRVSAFLTPAVGNGDAANYFTNEVFAENGGVWRHTPALYWPLASRLDFMAVSSTIPFGEKDAIWGEYNATSSLKLKIGREYTQDDVVYAAASMNSSDATGVESGVYTVAKPVNMTFFHSQAWLEFQLSVASDEMTDKIAIKEIVIENAHDQGELVLYRADASGSAITTESVDAKWNLDGYKDVVFDDSYEVYGRTKTAEDFPALKEAVDNAEAALKEAKNKGIQEDINLKQNALDLAVKALNDAIKQYELVNPLNAVGGENTGDCVYMDMLIPAQPKTSFVIRYVLAGQPTVLEYRYDLTHGGQSSNKWEMGKKYIYDLDFVISEITIAPIVKEFVAEFDADVDPVELM